MDDGYQTAWGDWNDLKHPEFPSRSLAPLVDRIKEAGMNYTSTFIHVCILQCLYSYMYTSVYLT